MWKKLIVPALGVALLVLVVVVQGPMRLPAPPPPGSLNAKLAGTIAGNPTPCSKGMTTSCLTYINAGNGPATAASYGQGCDSAEFTGPNGVNVTGTSPNFVTKFDGWLFVTDPVDFQKMSLDFFDGTAYHTIAFDVPAGVSHPGAPVYYAYVTKANSHVAVLTPKGWTLVSPNTRQQAIVSSYKNHFQLSHTCPAGSKLTFKDGECPHPPGPSQMDDVSVKLSGGSGTSATYTVTGTLTHNSCGEANQSVYLNGPTSTTTSWYLQATTSNKGAFTFAKVPYSKFSVYLHFLGTATQPPLAQPVKVDRP